jgi:hypothetical protein
MAFIRGANPIWLLADLTGKLFDDTFYLWVLENQIPYIPAPVYHDPDGTLPWTDPIQFLANGTLPIDIYWDDSIVYRLEFRQNDGTAPPSQADALIYLVENYIPNGEGASPEAEGADTTDNQITNGQFSLVNFTTPYNLTATNPPSIQVAPGWFLDLAGTGTLELQQVPLNNALANPTNAPYALRITLGGGWTGQPALRQRFQQNGQNWSNLFAATSITALSQNGTPPIIVRLDASNGQPLAVLLNDTLTGQFAEYKGINQLPASANPNVPPNAYIDYKILLPTVCDIYITSVQLTAGTADIELDYIEDTINRQLDHTFNYYNPLLQYKPIPSYLTAWDFPLNPAQFGVTPGAIATGANGSYYAWDQTIIFQTISNGVTVTRNATNGAITLTAAANGQCAIIQYLDQTQARELLSGNMSVGIRATSSAAALNCTIGLFATNDGALPVVSAGTYQSLIATLGAAGNVATFHGAGWVPLTPLMPGQTLLPITSTATEFFSTGWTDSLTTPRVANATFYAIVIGTSAMTAADTLTINWCSLNKGNIATRPAPQSADEVLRQCQRYYWKTFETATVPATAIGLGNGEVSWTGQAAGVNANINIEFGAAMRAIPNVTLFNPVNANANAFNNPVNLDCAPTTSADISTKRFRVSATSPAGAAAGSTDSIHAVADARLGVV